MLCKLEDEIGEGEAGARRKKRFPVEDEVEEAAVDAQPLLHHVALELRYRVLEKLLLGGLAHGRP